MGGIPFSVFSKYSPIPPPPVADQFCPPHFCSLVMENNSLQGITAPSPIRQFRAGVSSDGLPPPPYSPRTPRRVQFGFITLAFWPAQTFYWAVANYCSFPSRRCPIAREIHVNGRMDGRSVGGGRVDNMNDDDDSSSQQKRRIWMADGR
uniref:Uncharacterized protein n=1 Tax=Globodera rostochiensis TaxID=31243 RepID=A0A914H4F2_GLORO